MRRPMPEIIRDICRDEAEQPDRRGQRQVDESEVNVDVGVYLDGNCGWDTPGS